MFNHYQYLLGISGKAGSGKDLTANIIQFLCWEKRNRAFLAEKDSGFLSTNPISDKEFASALLDPIAVRELLHSNLNVWKVKRFAAGVKTIASLLTGIPVEKFEDQEFKKTFLGSEWNYTTVRGISSQSELELMCGSIESARQAGWCQVGFEKFQLGNTFQMTVRELLQKIGTDCLRDQLHPNVWLNCLFADWKTRYTASTDPIDGNLGGVGLDMITEWPAQHWLITDVRFPNEKQAIEQRKGLVIRVVRPGQEVTSTHPSETALDDATFEAVLVNDGTVEELVGKVRELLVKFGVL